MHDKDTDAERLYAQQQLYDACKTTRRKQPAFNILFSSSADGASSFSSSRRCALAPNPPPPIAGCVKRERERPPTGSIDRLAVACLPAASAHAGRSTRVPRRIYPETPQPIHVRTVSPAERRATRGELRVARGIRLRPAGDRDARDGRNHEGVKAHMRMSSETSASSRRM